MSVEARRIHLRSAEVEIAVAPHRGARISGLLDRRTGRNWLAGDARGPIPADADRFGAAAAAGWDECFPNVAAEASPGDAIRGRPLRDHGDLWGRAWRSVASGEQSLTLAYDGDGYEFERRLALRGETLEADYRVLNRSARALPFLWAAHPLLALRPGERLELPGVRTVEASYLSTAPEGARGRALAWPEGDGCAPFPLDRIQPASAHFAGKFFARPPSAGVARVIGVNQSLEIEWEGVDHLGLWLTYGAWPTRNDIVHVALEPTTAPFDSLAEAIAAGAAKTLAPGAERGWKVRVRLRVGGAA